MLGTGGIQDGRTRQGGSDDRNSASLGGDKDVLKVTLMTIAELCEYNKTYRIVCLK